MFPNPIPTLIPTGSPPPKRQGRKTRYPGIQELPDGQYRLRVVVRLEAQRMERERLVRAESLAQAIQARAQLEQELRQELQASVQQRLTVGASVQDWLTRQLESRRPDGTIRLAPTTRARYAQSVRDFIIPYLGDRTLEELTQQTVQDWVLHLGQTYLSNTVNGHLRILRHFLRDQGADHLGKVRALAGDDTRITDEEPNMLEGPEVQAFLEAARVVAPHHYALISLMFTTAMRINTALVLTRQDFIPSLGVVVARRRRSKTETLPGIKRGRNSVDRLPLLPEVWIEMQALWSQYSEVQLQSGLAFAGEKGGPMSRSVLDRWIPRITKEAGITKRLTPHGFRRTASNEYRRAVGRDMSMRVAGHTTSAMHVHYTRIQDDEALQAGKQTFQDILPKLTKTQP